jgi:glycosyltransferase involved in cell wall biosynthesis
LALLRRQDTAPEPWTATASSRGPEQRIAFVLHGFGGGGMERSMLRLAEGLIARGFGVDFVVAEAIGELVGEVPPSARIVELDRVRFWRARVRGFAADPRAWRLLLQPRSRISLLKPLLRRLPSMVDYFRRARPDAVLAAEPRFNLIAVWGRSLSGLGSRLVISERIQVSHHAAYDGPWGDRRLHGLLRRAYLKADGIVAVSDGVADDLATYSGIPQDRITTVYNPVVGPDLRRKARKPLDHPWFAAGEPPVILGAGRLDPQKDFATLIRAFARVRARRPARLVILGADSRMQPAYSAELRALPGTLGIAGDVAMPGFVDNPLAFMARSAVFVLSSLYEGLPGVLIQALACGCPVVSTDCPSGPREVLDHGRFGPLVPVGDAAALAEAIEAILDDPPPAERLRARAELFSVERAVDNYLKLLLPSLPSGQQQQS